MCDYYNMKTNNLNLIDTWLAVELCVDGMTKTEALADLNDALSTSYDLNRLGKWARGSESIPRPVANYMMRVGIEYALKKGGVNTAMLSDKQLDRIADMLTPPHRK